MKYIITENQQHILWFKRRIPQNLDLMMDLINEGFDYIDQCEYKREDGYQDFSSELIGSAAITFMNTFDEVNDLSAGDTDIVFQLIYDYMEKNYSEYILIGFMDRIEWCE
jgi:hypothetical protein